MPSKNQTGRNSGGISDAEKLQEQLLDRCHLFALVDLEESDNISPIFSEKVGLECYFCIPMISGIISLGRLSCISTLFPRVVVVMICQRAV